MFEFQTYCRGNRKDGAGIQTSANDNAILRLSIHHWDVYGNVLSISPSRCPRQKLWSKADGNVVNFVVMSYQGRLMC